MSEIIITTPVIGKDVDAVILNGKRFPMDGLCKIEFTVEAGGPVRLLLHYFPTIGEVKGIDIGAN